MKLKGAHIVARALVEEGVRVAFGIPGGAIMPFYDVLPQYPIRHILVRHESCAAHMADGYARASGQVGVCFGTSGPGAINLVTGIATAHLDSVPIVAITANVPTAFIGSDAFQEADITGITIPVTKQNYLVRNVHDLPRIMKEAFHIARTGRPGPVLVDVPKDVLTAETEWHYPDKVDLPGFNPTLDGNMVQIRKAARAIEEAQRPVIIAGHGVIISGAYDELRELAEKATIPVITTLLGISCFPEGHPLSLGFAGMHGWAWANYAIHHSDLVVAIGMRMDDRLTGKVSAFAPGAKIVHIDIDPAELGKNVRVDVPIVGDAKRVLQRLNPEIGPCRDRSAWLAQIREWQERYPPDEDSPAPGDLSTIPVVKGLYTVTRGDAYIVADVGQHQMFAAQHFTFNHPNKYITSGGLGTMGYALPAAIGVQVARPDATVWCVIGDGGFQMTFQELAVMAIERLPVKIALVNNLNLGMVRQWQEMFFKRNYVAVDLSGPPDFLKIAEAYGIPAWRVSRKEEVEPTIEKAMAVPGPALIEFLVKPEENVYPMVVPGTALSEVIVSEACTRRNGRESTVGAQQDSEPVPVPGFRH
jgi:acetolactate synthase-1/2/3 large subunit